MPGSPDPDVIKTQKDLQELEKYVMELFKEEYVNPRIRKQINEYISINRYSYSGILKTLIYAFEIKKHDHRKKSRWDWHSPLSLQRSSTNTIIVYIKHNN